MTQQIINVGTFPNDGTGDPVRTAYQKCNNNFNDFYSIYNTTTNALTISGHIFTPYTQNTFIVVPTQITTLVNGLNSNIAIAGSSLRVQGPTAAYSIGGFALPGTILSPDGLRLTVYNSVSQTLTIVNEDAGSTANVRIKTLTGGNVILRATGPSSASFFYDINEAGGGGAVGRWILIGSS